MRIGICDDNEQARHTVLSRLKTRPEVMERNIFEFRCGEALLEHLRRFVLDIVFLDCKMDGMDGIETAKAIRRRDNRLVIILLTDFAILLPAGILLIIVGLSMLRRGRRAEKTARA